MTYIKLKKHILYSTSILLVMLVLLSCKNETTKKIKNLKKETKAATTILKNVNTTQEKIEALSKEEPLSNKALKEWLPETLNGMKRTGYKSGSVNFANAPSIRGTFKEGNKEFHIEVTDGAGVMAGVVLMAGTTYQMGMEEEDERKHIKKVTENGIEARQTYMKQQNNTRLNFLYENRFYVEVRANSMTPEETWDAVEKIKLNRLMTLTK
ncbi:hypothetical protein [Seonamhaeicola sp. S2-3]|uniref:hypothetical protein n=1 Tax=Seonamhaeicola sp. S2-3 TaxID=1936081 RepID=UPI0012F7B1A2|nr:hypothetical protein [Seonamhaeicola sp. S2-3]